MNNLIPALISTVEMARPILNKLSDQQLTDTSIPPYYSCVGTHIRHILDFYRCIDEGLELAEVDLTARNRNSEAEYRCDAALQQIDELQEKMRTWSDYPADKRIWVIDDLGNGLQRLEYTFAALAAQANSHTIHHFALINFMLTQLGVASPEMGFGYNPTTPQGNGFNLAGPN